MSNEELLYWLEQESVNNKEAFLPADTPLGKLSATAVKSQLESLRKKHQRTIQRLINQQTFALSDFQAAFAERIDTTLLPPEKSGCFEFVHGDRFLVEQQGEIAKLLAELEKPPQESEAPKATPNTESKTDLFTKSVNLVYECELEELRNRQQRLFEEFQTDYIEQKGTLEKQLAQVAPRKDIQKERETESPSAKRVRFSPQIPHRPSPPPSPSVSNRVVSISTPSSPSTIHRVAQAPTRLSPSLSHRAANTPTPASASTYRATTPAATSHRAANPSIAAHQMASGSPPTSPAAHWVAGVSSTSHRAANPSPPRKSTYQQQPTSTQAMPGRPASRDPRIQSSSWNPSERPPEVASLGNPRPLEVVSSLPKAPKPSTALKKMVKPPEVTSSNTSPAKSNTKHNTGSLIDGGIIDIFGSELVLVERGSKTKHILGSTKDFDDALHAPHAGSPIYIRYVNGQRFFCRKKDHAKVAPVARLEPMIRNHLLKS